MGIAVSGLQVESARLSVSAHNTANLNTPGFKADQVYPVALADGGVRVDVSSTGAPTDLVAEVVQQITALVGYRANAAVLRTADEMLGTLLDTRA